MPVPGMRSTLLSGDLERRTIGPPSWPAVALLVPLLLSACSSDSPPAQRSSETARDPAATERPPADAPAPSTSPSPPVITRAPKPAPAPVNPRAGSPARGQAPQVPRDDSSAPRSTPELPAFDWPPPRYSAFVEIPRAWIAPGDATLGSVAQRLERAFDSAGYAERSYFWIPGGFALASRIEQIQADAAPAAVPERWAVAMDRPPQGFVDFIRALFDARPGLYRVIVFAATNADYSAGERAPAASEARSWMYRGLMQLPASVGTLPYRAEHHTMALIYEFEQRADRSEPRVRQPSDSPGRVHLDKSGLLQALASR